MHATYPLPRPDHSDQRLSYGLLTDIADVLVRHGFPQPTGTDWAQLLLAVGHFCYQEPTT